MLLAAAPAARAEFVPPPLTSPVMDTAHLMDPVTEQKLASALRSLWSQGGSQVVVLTVDQLHGIPIEQASIKVTDTWKLGTGTKDNGVLLLISAADRSIRIEVGQGLEGQLTDAHSRRIIDRVMIPYFRSGDPSTGIVAGVAAILQHTDPGFSLDDIAPEQLSQRHGPSLLLVMLVLIVLVLRHYFGGGSGPGGMGRGRRIGSSGLYWGGSGYSSGGGGFSGGGGGFSGGGGGFSGGGASGKW